MIKRIPPPESFDELPENNPPMRLSGLRPIRVLRGGMSFVYLCDGAQSHWPYDEVAVKRLTPKLAANPTAARRFLRECYLWLQLGPHPNVVSALTVHRVHAEAPFLVLEFVPRSMRDLMARLGSLELDACMRLLIGIVDGLSYVRRELSGFVHADLKPENVLVTDDEIAKITDLGLSRALVGPLTQRSSISSIPSGGGTPLYMAPEQIQGRSVSGATDIYALGCIAQELITGVPTYGSPGTLDDYLKRHLHAKAVALDVARPGIPHVLAEVVSAALAKSPNDRPSLEDLRSELRSIALNEAGLDIPEPAAVSEETQSGTTAAQGLINLGFYEDARLAAERSIQRSPGKLPKFHARIIIARSYSEEGNYAQAERELDAAELIGKDVEGALTDGALAAAYYVERGRIAEGQGDSRREIEYAINTIRAAPNASTGYANAALAFKRSGDIDKAIEMMYRAINIAVNLAYFGTLVNMLREAGRSEEALDVCDKMISFHPTEGQAYAHRAMTRVLSLQGHSSIERSTYERLRNRLISDVQSALRYGVNAETAHALQALLDYIARG